MYIISDDVRRNDARQKCYDYARSDTAGLSLMEYTLPTREVHWHLQNDA